jgi:hypothetical protein
MLLNDEDSAWDLDFEDNNLREHGFFILGDEFPSEEDIDSDEDEELDLRWAQWNYEWGKDKAVQWYSFQSPGNGIEGRTWSP